MGGAQPSVSQFPAEMAPMYRTAQSRHAGSAAPDEAGRVAATITHQQTQRPTSAQRAELVSGQKRSASSAVPASRRANQLHMLQTHCMIKPL